MATQNLLTVNVDELFEQHSIQEINQLQKKLQTDIENKREELRTMVGERYRDLLKAADTIENMKGTAINLVEHIDGIITSCKSLNDHQLIGFKIEKPPTKRKESREVHNYYGIVMQIKILTTLPESIWSCIDNEDYLVATQLFLFSRHISTGLQLDVNKTLLTSFPVAKKQWTILSQFQKTIKQACNSALKREQISIELAAKCLASLLLLENSSMEKLFSSFIQIRIESFINALSDSGDETKNVRDKVLDSLNILYTTMELLHKCFLCHHGMDSGLLFIELDSIVSVTSRPTIELTKLHEHDIAVETLPDIIANFRPQLKLTKLNDEFIKTETNLWLTKVKQIAENDLKYVMELVVSIKAIYSMKKEALELDKPEDYSRVLKSLYLPNDLDLYQFCYKPLMTARIRDIVQLSCKSIITDSVERIRQSIDTLEDERKISIWTENTDDVPKSLEEALSNDKQRHKLLMRTKGFNKSILSICNELDKKYEVICTDVNLYISQELDKHKKLNAEEKRDHLNIVSFLRSACKESILDLISNIKSMKINDMKPEVCLMLARLLDALIELCPNLKLCFSQSSLYWEEVTSANLELWNSVCKLLKEESLNIWKIWLTKFFTGLNMSNTFTDIDTISNLLRDLPQWQTITIDQTDDEQHESVTSTLRVPSHLSYNLQSYLHEICQNLVHIAPNGVPSTISNTLNIAIAKQLEDSYSNLSKRDMIKQNQNASMQYFYDVKFISQLFVTRESKELTIQYQQLVNTFKSNIDPIDFEILHKHINDNMKRTIQRMHHQLAYLITVERLAAIGCLNQTTKSLQEKEPNTLVLCNTSNTTFTWFPCLPIMQSEIKLPFTAATDQNVKNQMMSNSNSTVTQKQRSRETNTNSGSSSNYAGNVKSGAAAFFGAMSQDWFR